MTDAELAAQLAEDTGRFVMKLRDGDPRCAAEIGKAADKAANDRLVAALCAARPDDGLLSEERRCDGKRLAKSRVWIVDPVDGTREYGERRSDWAVHVALAINGVAAVGAVALPDAGRVLRSDRPAPLPAIPDRPRIVVSRTRPACEALAVAETLCAELVTMGSAGAKAMAVVLGDAEIYLHSGGQSEWDSAAPVAVARAYGLHCSRLDGSELRYNQRDVSVPDLLICRPELAARVIDLAAGCR